MAKSLAYSVHLTGSLMIWWILLITIINRRGDKADPGGIPISCFYTVEPIVNAYLESSFL